MKFLAQIFLLLLLVAFISFDKNLASKNYNIDEFLSCLPLKSSNASKPIQNSIFTPNNPSFSSILQAYIRNLRFNLSTTPKPLAIITAFDKSHVQATVLCAKENGLEIRIRSGGHDFEGLSYVSTNPFIILDLFNLRSIDIDPVNETGWVESGASLGELYYNIGKISHTLAFPAGVCFTVGAGGHFSGGGYGTLIRKYGLIVDHIVDAEIVDSNGRILNRETMGEDLFWAIRGGGAYSFCVVLRWKVKLVRVPQTVTTFLVLKTLDQNASDVFNRWQHVAPNIDPNLFIRAHASARGKVLKIGFFGLYLGKARDLMNLMDKEFFELGLKYEDCNEQNWVQSHFLFNNLPLNTSVDVLLHRGPSSPLTFDKHKSDYVDRVIPKAGLDGLWKKMVELEDVSMEFNPYGGKMGEIPEDATPFPHRNGKLFKIQYFAYWNDTSSQVLERNINATREIYEFMTPFVSSNPRETFLNYRDIDVGTNAKNRTEFGFRFFKGNLERLLMVKAKVDPTNFFRNEQSIPVLPNYNSFKALG